MASISLEEAQAFLQSGNFDLYPTQEKLCLPILQRIYHKMKIGVVFSSINVANNFLIEGHHRYICALLAQRPVSRNTWEKPTTLTPLQWTAVAIDINDWETKEMINRHNAKDAARSGIDRKALESSVAV